MNALLKKLSKLALLPDYIAVTFRQALKQLPPNEKAIVFTLDDTRLYNDADGSGRYAYLTLNLFADAGYNVYLLKNVDFLTFTRLGSYGRMIYLIKNLKVISKLPDDTGRMVYAFDSVHKDILDRPWHKLTYVNMFKPPSCKVGELIPLTYFTHPVLYKFGQLERIGELRKSRRTMRVFFGGNTVKYYENPAMHRYGQMTRMEGINAVLELGDKIKTIRDLSEVDELMSTDRYINEGRLLRTDHKMVYDIKKWPDLVAKSDFFICFSGTDVPYCHNAVEALAVGTIPIISYADWFTPSLEHKKNAIVYSGKEDLKRKLKEVLEMSSSEIEAMRRNVIEYYDQHLGAKNFIRRYESNKEKVNTIILHPKFIAKPFEQREAESVHLNLKKHLGGRS